MRIAVIGASGRIGRRIVDEARQRGHAVIAVVRDASAVDIARFPNGSSALEVAQADAFDPVTITSVIADSQVVVSAVGHAASLDDQPFYLRTAHSLIEALRAVGPDGPRLLIVGGFGALTNADGTQLADVGGFADHAAPEIVGQRDALTYYRTVDDIRWTYFCPPPGGIRPGVRTGSYRSSLDGVIGEAHEGRISMEDFAVAMIDEAERAQHPFACLAVAN